MSHERLTVPGTSHAVCVERDDAGRLTRLEAGGRVYFEVCGGTVVLDGGAFGTFEELALAGGLLRTVSPTGADAWTERYTWDAHGRATTIDGVRVERDDAGRVVACRGASAAWQYRWREDRLAGVRRPGCGWRTITPGADGRPVRVRDDGCASQPIGYGDDGVRRSPAGADEDPPGWHRDPMGRLWTVQDPSGAVRWTFLWDGWRCLGRIDGEPSAPLAAYFSLDPSGTPVRVTDAAGRSERIERDLFGESLLDRPGVPALHGGLAHRGLVRFHARALDPRCGSYDRRDPWHGLEEDPRRADGFRGPLPVEAGPGGPYAVCRNDPLTRTDPTGAMSFGHWLLSLTWASQYHVVNFAAIWLSMGFLTFPLSFFIPTRGKLGVQRLFDWSVMSSPRREISGLRLDPWPLFFGAFRGFTFGQVFWDSADDESWTGNERPRVFVPAADYVPSCYGTLQVAAPARMPAFVLSAMNTPPRATELAAWAGIPWTRAGGTGRPAFPHARTLIFPRGGLHFDPNLALDREHWFDTGKVGAQDGHVREFRPTGNLRIVAVSEAASTAEHTDLDVDVGSDAGVAAQAFSVHPLAAAVPTPAADLVTGATFDAATNVARLVLRAPPPSTGGPAPPPVVPPGIAAPAPGQFVLAGPAGSLKAAVVKAVRLEVTLDQRLIAGLQSVTFDATLLEAVGVGHDADQLGPLRLLVRPERVVRTAGSAALTERTEILHFAAGDLVRVTWNGNPRPRVHRVMTADGADLRLHPGPGPLPPNTPGLSVRRMDAADPLTGSHRIGLNGHVVDPTRVGGTGVMIDVWGPQTLKAGDALALASAAGSVYQAVVASVDVLEVELFAGTGVAAGPIDIKAPTIAGGKAWALAPGAPAAGKRRLRVWPSFPAAPFAAICAHAPLPDKEVAGRFDPGTVRLPTAPDDAASEISHKQAIIDHELTHSEQYTIWGPLFMSIFPAGAVLSAIQAGGGNVDDVRRWLRVFTPGGISNLIGSTLLAGWGALGRAAAGTGATGAVTSPERPVLQAAGLQDVEPVLDILYDPYGAPDTLVPPPRDTGSDVVLRVLSDLVGTHGWIGPGFGAYVLSLLRRGGQSRSGFEQDAASNSGECYTPIGRFTGTPTHVGDIGRYWLWEGWRHDSAVLLNVGQGRGETSHGDAPGVHRRRDARILPSSSDDAAIPDATAATLAPNRRRVPAGEADAAGAQVAAALVRADPDHPHQGDQVHGLAYGFPASDVGVIPVDPRLVRTNGSYVAFSRPHSAGTTHRVTATNVPHGGGDWEDNDAAGDVARSGVQQLWHDVEVTDVAVTVNGVAVAENGRVQLLRTEEATIAVTPNGARRYRVVVLAPIAGVVLRRGLTDLHVKAGERNGAEPVDIVRVYAWDGASGRHVDPALGPLGVHLAGRDLEIAVRRLTVEVTEVVPVRTAGSLAAPVRTTPVRPGENVFVAIPVANPRAPQIAAVAHHGIPAASVIAPVLPAGSVTVVAGVVGLGAGYQITLSDPPEQAATVELDIPIGPLPNPPSTSLSAVFEYVPHFTLDPVPAPALSAPITVAAGAGVTLTLQASGGVTPATPAVTVAAGGGATPATVVVNGTTVLLTVPPGTPAGALSVTATDAAAPTHRARRTVVVA